MGGAVARALQSAGHEVIGAVRNLPTSIALTGNAIKWEKVGEINNQTKWGHTLLGVEAVIHCAARAHVMRGYAGYVLAAYREVNVAGTLFLAQQAASAGVKRFIFISSIKVNGESTVPDKAFNEFSLPAPEDEYGQSKLEAEHALLSLAERTNMEVVIIRPPLIYGPGVKGNFATLLKCVQLGIPLPLGSVNNQRSLLALDNLVSLIMLCIDRSRSPQAANQTFLVADGEDISTTLLLRKVAKAARCPIRLLPVPASILRTGAFLCGKEAMALRLLDSLKVDDTKVRTLIGWRPIVSMDEQLDKMFFNTTN